jgi:hypothetical protein
MDIQMNENYLIWKNENDEFDLSKCQQVCEQI